MRLGGPTPGGGSPALGIFRAWVPSSQLCRPEPQLPCLHPQQRPQPGERMDGVEGWIDRGVDRSPGGREAAWQVRVGQEAGKPSWRAEGVAAPHPPSQPHV